MDLRGCVMSDKLTTAQEYLDSLVQRDHMHYGEELATLQKALNAYNDEWRDKFDALMQVVNSQKQTIDALIKKLS